MPNFYFILFDELSTVPVVQKYFDYDNSDLLKKLEELGFTTSQSGHNESASTAVVTANLFNLDYLVTSRDTEELKFSLRSNNEVFPQLREAGYTITGLGNASFYGLRDAIESQPQGATTVSGENVGTILLKNTVIYPYLLDYYPEAPRAILKSLDFLKDPANCSGHNQFLLAHIVCPHPPFYFNADGSLSDNVTSGWSDLNSYLNQYIFISNEMVQIAKTIVDNDPDAVVWILSDHGARATEDPRYGFFSVEDMTNFFNAVYYRGEQIDIEGLSGVNTFRTILNRLIGTDYEMVLLPGER